MEACTDEVEPGLCFVDEKTSVKQAGSGLSGPKEQEPRGTGRCPLCRVAGGLGWRRECKLGGEQ